jgi:hypothetical protein
MRKPVASRITELRGLIADRRAHRRSAEHYEHELIQLVIQQLRKEIREDRKAKVAA